MAETRLTLDQEAASAADTLLDTLPECVRVGASDGWDAVAYERARAAGHAALKALAGTAEEQKARVLARAAALRAAVVAGYREQGLSDCDHCGRLARWTWELTPEQLRAASAKLPKHGPTWIREADGTMRSLSVKPARVSRTQRIDGRLLRVRWLCDVHRLDPRVFPDWAPEYRDALARRPATAVKAVA
jgi:hypothetical protein